MDRSEPSRSAITVGERAIFFDFLASFFSYGATLGRLADFLGEHFTVPNAVVRLLEDKAALDKSLFGAYQVRDFSRISVSDLSLGYFCPLDARLRCSS